MDPSGRGICEEDGAMFGRQKRTVEQGERPRTTMWSPTQIVAGIIAAASLVLGSFAIGRTGLNTDHLFSPHVSVATLHHTPLLALSELAFGILMLWAATKPFLGRGLMALLGIAVLGLGIVTITDIWPDRLHHWLGVHHRNGWLFVLVGAVSLVTALFLPTFRTRREVVVREAVDETAAVSDEQPDDTTTRRRWWQRRRRRAEHDSSVPAG
jgi:hypothetical protein